MLTPLRRKRILSQLSIYDISLQTGIQASKISLIERNYIKPTADEKRKLSEVLKCEVKELFGDNKFK